jgi:hypothetical protein
MNTKLAKRLRRDAGYHPRQEAVYVDVPNHKVRLANRPKFHRELDAVTAKAIYRELKKEFRK